MSLLVNDRSKEARLKRALRTMATVIDHYGETYWPIFETLEQLLEQEKHRQASLERFRPVLEKAKTLRSNTPRQSKLTRPIADSYINQSNRRKNPNQSI